MRTLGFGLGLVVPLTYYVASVALTGQWIASLIPAVVAWALGLTGQFPAVKQAGGLLIVVAAFERTGLLNAMARSIGAA